MLPAGGRVHGTFALRKLAWDLSTGLAFRPGVVIVLLAAAGWTLPRLEAAYPSATLATWLGAEPGAAQVVLGTVASSMITVVSSVYSILLVALSLASIQFSTRIVIGYLRDSVSQYTLGACIGTFAYALLVLRSVSAGDAPFAPPVAVALAPLLALASLAAVVLFIHHIALGIQANHIVDRIATETERVIDEVFPHPRAEAAPVGVPPVPADAVSVPSERSGYIQLIDLDALGRLAAPGRRVHLARPMGAFVPRGAPLVYVSPAEPVTPELVRAANAACDLGPVRTMQGDAEYGFRQIVDVALKALSPAVNDPSTAATCLDHLDRLLIRVAGRDPLPAETVVGAGRVVVATTSFVDLLDLAVDQIRQYGRADLAVSLRLLRVLSDVSRATSDPVQLDRIRTHADLVVKAARAAFPDEPTEELERRRAAIRA